MHRTLVTVLCFFLSFVPVAARDLSFEDRVRAQEAIERVFCKAKLHPSLVDPSRQVTYSRYLSLFLFGLFNTVVETMRGL